MATKPSSGLFSNTSGNTVSIRDSLLNEVKNSKLKNAVNEMFRPGATVGNGGLADAIRFEIQTGELAGGKSHITKGKERLKNLENIINKQVLSKNDKIIAQKLYDDLKDSLKGI